MAEPGPAVEVRRRGIVGDHPLTIWALGLVAVFLAGTFFGTTLFGAALLAVHRARGATAWEAANQVFTGQSIQEYKNLLRMRFGADGTLTIHPRGVERDWRYAARDGSQPRFAPGGPPPSVEPIDVPLRYDATGRRVS